MKKPNPRESIFGGYDVRGVYGENFTEAEALDLGKAYGTFLARETGLGKKRQPKIVLGMDNRVSSPSVRDSFVKGLLSTGCNVVDVGVVPTPVVYFACFALETDGAAVVTASHNPPQYNGVKMLSGIWPLSSRQLISVKQLFLSRKFVEKPELGMGKVFKREVLDDYLKFTCKLLPKLDGMKIVVDGGNGVVGDVGVKFFRRLGAKVIPLYCEPDGSFPNHLPDPSKPENVRDLQARVLREGADLGVAYDGDGDRSVFIDEKGAVVRSDDANILFIRELLRGRKGEKMGFELRCSLSVKEEIERLGGIALETKAGRLAVRESMKNGALFACETTGHVCFRENNTFDDGIFSSGKFAGVVFSAGKPASQLVSTVKHYPATRELRIHCEHKEEAVDFVKNTLESKGMKLLLIDGVKYSDAGGWGLVRASNTEPLLSMRFEGRTESDLERIYLLFSSSFPDFVKLPPLKEAF